MFCFLKDGETPATLKNKPLKAQGPNEAKIQVFLMILGNPCTTADVWKSYTNIYVYDKNYGITIDQQINSYASNHLHRCRTCRISIIKQYIVSYLHFGQVTVLRPFARQSGGRGPSPMAATLYG